MTKTILLGATLAAVFAVSMMMVPAFAGGHLVLDKVEVKDNVKQSLEINAGANIPQDGSVGAFGYGAFGTKAVLAITTHGGVGPDSETQTGTADPVFHTHAVQLTTTTPCASGLAVASASFKEVGDLEVSGDTVEVKNISNGKIGTLTGTVVSFTLTVESGDICVNVINVAASE